MDVYVCVCEREQEEKRKKQINNINNLEWQLQDRLTNGQTAQQRQFYVVLQIQIWLLEIPVSIKIQS